MPRFANWDLPGVFKDHFDKSNFETPRADGRYDRTLGFIHHYIANIKPKLSFDTVQSPEEYPQWRQKVRAKYRELLDMRNDLDVEFVLLSEEQRDGYRLYKYEFYPEPYLAVPIFVLIPDSVLASKKPAPAVICSPGSGASLYSLAGEPDNYINRYPKRNKQAWFYAQAGMIGVAIENPATACNSEPDVEYGQVQTKYYSLMTLAGRSYHGMCTEQRMMIVEFLKKHPLVDNSKIAVSGLSLGCGGVLPIATVCDDIAAAVYNDFICSHQARVSATTEISSALAPAGGQLYGAMEWFDIQPDLQAALAPMPVLFTEGGPWKGHLEKIVRAYEMAGASDKLTYFYYDKYADPANRKYEDVDLHDMRGLSPLDYLEYSNVDASQHSFHSELAVPWMMDQFFGHHDMSEKLKAAIAEAKAEKEVILR